jgi:hypothetical protein
LSYLALNGIILAEEEARIRADHRKQIEERARLRGLRLIDPSAVGPQK